MRLLRYVPALLPLSLCGCHVVERAQRCEELAAIMKEAAPEIERTKIDDSPPPKVLRKKARLYGQLADKLDKVVLKDKRAHEEQAMLIVHLRNLEKHLIDAGDAVEAEAAFEKHQEQQRARHEEILASRERYAQTKADEARTAQASAGESGKAGGAKPTDSGVSRGMTGFLERAQRRADPRKGAPPRHHSPNVRKYEQAKHAAETIGRAVDTSTRNLGEACR